MFIEFIGITEPDNAIYIPEEIWFTRNNGKIDEISNDSFCMSYIDKDHYGVYNIKTSRRFAWKGAKVTYLNKKGKITISDTLSVKQLNELLDNNTFRITCIKLKQSKDSIINIKRIHIFGDTNEEICYENKDQKFYHIIRSQQEKEEELRNTLKQLNEL